MARTPLARYLAKACEVAGESLVRKVPVENVIAERAQRGLTRREFLVGAGVAGVAAAFPGVARAATAGRTQPEASIAIVGAGLAGLTCAYRLQQAGCAATLYEGSERLGGRCWTIRDAFASGQIAEHGGELIDTDHRAVRRLAIELGLSLDDLPHFDGGTEELYYFFGRPYTYGDAAEEMKAVWKALHDDLKAADYPTKYNRYKPSSWALDHMSISDWIESRVPGGHRSPLGQLLDVAYVIEFGAPCSDQSALNLIYLLGYAAEGRFALFGTSDERFHIRGGNDQLVTGLAERFQGEIKLGHRLVRVEDRSPDGYRLTFATAGGTREVMADRVVLALPFSILRTDVDISGAGFQPLKQTAIREVGMGANSKLHLQFRRRFWHELGCNGETYADTGYQNTWEVTRGQPGLEGILVNYTGGAPAVAAGRGLLGDKAQAFLAQLEPVLPGITAQYNGMATVDVWSANPWTRGSYSYYKVGQYTQFAGVEAEPEGRCFFAGEHTSLAYQGYLNGAVDSGQRAASEVLASLGRRRRWAG